MDPTLHDGQVLGISRLAYVAEKPSKGDIVVLYYQGDESKYFVKRITAVPGDRVSYAGRTAVLGEREYFVEGDNRDHSTDSRIYGPINLDQIVGKVVLW